MAYSQKSDSKGVTADSPVRFSSPALFFPTVLIVGNWSYPLRQLFLVREGASLLGIWNFWGYGGLDMPT
jgi:hypothetical protein